jgi:hypothetical protein
MRRSQSRSRASSSVQTSSSACFRGSSIVFGMLAGPSGVFWGVGGAGAGSARGAAQASVVAQTSSAVPGSAVVARREPFRRFPPPRRIRFLLDRKSTSDGNTTSDEPIADHRSRSSLEARAAKMRRAQQLGAPSVTSLFELVQARLRCGLGSNGHGARCTGRLHFASNENAALRTNSGAFCRKRRELRATKIGRDERRPVVR